MNTPKNETGAVMSQLMAGATVVISMLPVDMLYGVTIMAALGPAASSFTVWASFLPLVLGNALLAWAAPGCALFSGLRPAQTVMLVALVEAVQRNVVLGEGGMSMALASMVLTVSTAGALQWLVGYWRLGRVIKFIPLPVLVGVTNGSAIALTWLALKDVIGAHALSEAYSALSQGDAGAWMRLAVVGGLLGLMGWSAYQRWRMHWSLVGLVCGTLLYQLTPTLFTQAASVLSQLGGTLPPAPHVDMHPVGLFALGSSASWLQWGELIRLTLPLALGIGAINSIDTLISLAYVETLNGKRIDANLVLRKLGIANCIGGLLGGLPVAPSTGRILIGFQAKAVNWRAPAAGAVTAALLIAVLPYLVDYMPRLAASAVMIYLAWTLIDNWSRRSVKSILSKQTPMTLRADLLLMMFVTGWTVSFGTIAAIAVGLIISMAIFVRSHSRSVISAMHRGDERRSLVVRTPAEDDYLKPLRPKILLIELSGALFFGTADAMRDAIEALIEPDDQLILSFRSVSEIDASGAGTVARMTHGLKGLGVQVYLSDVLALSTTARVQLMTALHGQIAPNRVLADADRALQMAEDHLLEQNVQANAQPAPEYSLESNDLLQGMTPQEIATIAPYFTREHYASGQTIFTSGQAADAMYILVLGEVEILLSDEGSGHKRLGLFRPGVVLGEMGLLQQRARSADAYARSDVTLHALHAQALAQLKVDHPEQAYLLMLNIARQLAARLAIANTELRFALQI